MKTYGQQMDEALALKTEEDAACWLNREIDRLYVEYDVQPRTKGLSIIKQNLGYMAGYYDDATAKKIHELFGANHPIFGTSTYFKDVSPEQAFETGQTIGKAMKSP